MSETPVLLIAFRRPYTTQQVIDAIRQVKPKQLFIACDGPRADKPGEADACRETRKVIEENINWDCEVKKFYSDVNQGCRRGVSNAITWFFEYVEEGIILEDDCVPHADFFSFCGTLLEHYRHDTRVWCISGDNFQDGQWRGDGSYYFSRYPHCWGWATWRRAWQHYDAELSTWSLVKASNLLRSILPDPLEFEAWTYRFNCLLEKGEPDTWDYIWQYSCWINNALTALPNVNLVQNIGFNSDATHTIQKVEIVKSIPLNPLRKVQHPSVIIRNEEADAYTFSNHFGGKFMRDAQTSNIFIGKLRLRLARMKQRTKRLFIDPVGLFYSLYHKII